MLPKQNKSAQSSFGELAKGRWAFPAWANAPSLKWLKQVGPSHGQHLDQPEEKNAAQQL